MNRYITRGILDDLAKGRAVLVLSPSLSESERAHAAVLDRVHADALEDDQGDGYAWSNTNGGQWIRDEHTRAAAVFTSIRSSMADHAGGDVVVINGLRRILGDAGTTAAMITERDRLTALAAGRPTVVID